MNPSTMRPLVRPLIAATLGVLSCTVQASDTSRPTAKPNVLFIITDDQSYDALSIVQKEQGGKGRFPWLQTPNMDRLSAEGVRFRNAFVTNSLCSPSRAVNLTGLYNHESGNGIASNFRPFSVNSVTHATLMRDAGYTTAYVGKWHMGNQRERPGFDHHASYVGHGRYQDCPFIVDGRETATTGWVDDVATDHAIEFIEKQKTSVKPWSLILGFKTPHQPWEPPARTKNLYAGEVARTVPNMKTPPIYWPKPTRGWTTNLDYFRCISAIDECVGRLLEVLDQSGFASRTIVVFTSDNGFYLGAHATGDKRSAYEESLRVPLIVRYPALGPAAQGRIVDEMVLNLDLAPTLLDFAGLTAPKAMQGQSWRPLLTGRTVPWRQSWFYEYFVENQKNTRVPDMTAVRTADAKLILYPGHKAWTELFDLKNDPYETKNLIADPAAASLKARLLAEHDRLAREVGFRVPPFVDRPPDWGQPGGLAGDLSSP